MILPVFLNEFNVLNEVFTFKHFGGKGLSNMLKTEIYKLGLVASNSPSSLMLGIFGASFYCACYFIGIPIWIPFIIGLSAFAPAFYLAGFVLVLMYGYATSMGNEESSIGRIPGVFSLFSLPACCGSGLLYGEEWMGFECLFLFFAGMGGGGLLLTWGRLWCRLFEENSIPCMRFALVAVIALGAMEASLITVSSVAPLIEVIPLALSALTAKALLRGFAPVAQGRYVYHRPDCMRHFFVVAMFGGVAIFQLMSDSDSASVLYISVICIVIPFVGIVASTLVSESKYGAFVDTVTLPVCCIFCLFSCMGDTLLEVIGNVGMLAIVLMMLVDNINFMTITYFRSGMYGYQRIAGEFLFPTLGVAVGMCVTFFVRYVFGEDAQSFILVMVMMFCGVLVLSTRPISIDNLFEQYRFEHDAFGEEEDMMAEASEAVGDNTDPYSESILSLSKEYGLSKRESQVLTYLARGRSAAVTADHLFISTNTVKTHTLHIYQKLGVRSRQELLDFCDAYRLGQAHEK